MAPNGTEPRAWSLSNKIITAMGAIIVILLGLGFASIQSQIRDGDVAINSQLAEIKAQYKDSNAHILEFVKELGMFKTEMAIIKTNQVARMERERIQAEDKARRVK